jgi:hypothetical protein
MEMPCKNKPLDHVAAKLPGSSTEKVSQYRHSYMRQNTPQHGELFIYSTDRGNVNLQVDAFADGVSPLRAYNKNRTQILPVKETRRLPCKFSRFHSDPDPCSDRAAEVIPHRN